MAMLTESGLRRLIKEELRKVLMEQAPEGSIAGSGGSTYNYESLKGAELRKLIKPEELENLKNSTDQKIKESVNTIIAEVYANVDFIPFTFRDSISFKGYRQGRRTAEGPGKFEMYEIARLPRNAFTDGIKPYLNMGGSQGSMF